MFNGEGGIRYAAPAASNPRGDASHRGASVAGLTFNSTIHSVVSASTYTTPIITLIAIVFVAVLYPALKAAFINPIAAIHHK